MRWYIEPFLAPSLRCSLPSRSAALIVAFASQAAKYSLGAGFFPPDFAQSVLSLAGSHQTKRADASEYARSSKALLSKQRTRHAAHKTNPLQTTLSAELSPANNRRKSAHDTHSSHPRMHARTDALMKEQTTRGKPLLMPLARL